MSRQLRCDCDVCRRQSWEFNPVALAIFLVLALIVGLIWAFVK